MADTTGNPILPRRSNGRRFSSFYTPLVPDGPLPPGLTDLAVANAYRSQGFRPKKVLLSLGIRQFSEVPAARLRRALDHAEARAKRGDRRSEKYRPPFYEALYNHLLQFAPHAQDVYNRLVKPAEHNREGHTFLDPVRFRTRIEAERGEAPDFSLPIEPNTEYEALAQFALAFALLQPTDAYDILEPVLLLGRGFQEFFGVTEVDQTAPIAEMPGPAASDRSGENAGVSARDVIINESAQARSQVVERGAHALPTTLSGIGEAATPSDSSQATAEPRALPTEKGRLGPNSAALARCRAEVELTRSRRRELGSAIEFDRTAFEEALKAEVFAIDVRAQTLRNIQLELNKFLDRIITAVKGQGIEAQVEHPVAEDEQAAWLDEEQDHLSEVVALTDELTRKQNLLSQIEPKGSAARAQSLEPLSIHAAVQVLQHRLESLDARIEAAHNWQATLGVLRDRLADCAVPRESLSLLRLEPELIHTLLRRANVDEAFEPLAPLLFRLLGEILSWAVIDPPSTGLPLLHETLNRAASSGDMEAYQDVLSYLPPRMLQELLASGHEAIIRHVVFAAFRASIARREPLFFVDIWPYEQGWRDRESCLGERTFRLFTALQQLYWRTGDISSVIDALTRPGSSSGEAEEAGGRMAAARRQAAEDLVQRLETTGNMTGHFYRLRQIASNRFFGPLIPSIQARRVREVQSELVRLERKFQSGELENEALDALGDPRGLRPDHRTNLRRYIDSDLQAVGAWVKQEQSLLRGQDKGGENELLEEIRVAIARLPVVIDKVPLPDTVAGGPKWLEQSVGSLIKALRGNEWPEASLAFFGELPPSDTFFALPGSAATAGGTEAHWPSWLEPTPQSERSWVCHLRGRLTWKDLLQDGVAKIILNRRRLPEQIIESFIQCGELEAAVEAGRFPEFRDPGAARLVGQARDRATRQDAVEEHLDRIDRRLRALSVEGLADETKQIIQRLEAEVYEVLADLDKLDLEKASRQTKLIAQRLDSLEEQIRTADADNRRRLEGLRVWLSEAGSSFPEEASLGAAERLVEEIRERESPRRVHLIRLVGLDSPDVPDRLRESIRAFLHQEDRPSRWPDPERAAWAELYIENLLDVARHWWSTLRDLDPGDITYQKAMEVATLLGERLTGEIKAIVSGTVDQAPLLTLLLEKTPATIAECHLELHRQKLIVAAGADEGLPPQEGRLEAEPIWPWLQAQRRVEGLMAEAKHPPGSAVTIQDAYKAFGEGRYEEARTLCGTAWEWAHSHSVEQEVGPLLAMYAWSRCLTQGAAYDRAEIDALSLVLRHGEKIGERAKGMGPTRMLEWWISVMDGNGGSTGNAPLGARVAAVLIRLAGAPIGAPVRDRFATILRIAGPPTCAEALWSAVRNLRDDTTHARSALLILLYDLGEEEALEHLFGYAPSHRKYLSAFMALAKRARSEPSAKLLAAIRQNLTTLQSLADTWFKEFTEKIARRLQPVPARILLDVPPVLERDKILKHYTLVVTIQPDETDPPLSLQLELLDTSDFVCAENVSPEIEVVKETLLFERRELEFVVRPKRPEAASNVALRVTGETASGQGIDETRRFQVQLGGDDHYEPLPVPELLEIYAGCDGRPVSGPAFVGREEELAILERSVVRSSPGAVVLFGARRLGKTSLLDELRRRYCVTARKGSETLFLVIPVDEFSVTDGAKPLIDRFLRHIWNSIVNDPKNHRFRQLLEELGVSRQQLQIAGRLEGDFVGTSFLMRLREYVRRLRELAAGRLSQIVLVLDEFDKLLESYWKGYEAEVGGLTNQLRRAATEEMDIGLVLAGSDLMRRVVGQYRNAFYGSATTIQLECFTGGKHRLSARRIVAPEALRRRRLFGEDVLDDIIRITGGHPLYMRLVACAAAHLSRRQRVTRGTVNEAVHRLLRNVVLQGHLPDVPTLVMQPLQAVRLLETTDQLLAELLLRQFARHTTLERPWVNWATVVQDDRLLNLRPKETWTRLRQELWDANLLVMDDRKQWAFRFPILGERLRIDLEPECDRLQTEALAKLGVET